MRYSYEITGEAVLNPDYYGYAAGRIEVWDDQNDSGYPIEEFRYFIPAELEQKFREFVDSTKSDLPIMIHWGEFEDIKKKTYCDKLKEHPEQ